VIKGKRMLTAVLVTAGIGAAAVAGIAAMGQRGASQDAGWYNRQALALAALKPADGWRPLRGGVMWRRVKGTGQGAHPAITDTVTIHYAGRLVDGTEFDSSYTRGEPATFPLSGLIPAWQIAVPEMGVGDTIEIVSPADAAYGPQGQGPIPGGATLLFTIELLGIGG